MELIRQILERTQTVAVVGFSTDPRKAAHRVPLRMIEHGYTVTPVHPTARAIAGRLAIARLTDLDAAPDLVVVFRPSAEAPTVAADAIEIGTRALWLQLGITSSEARRLAGTAGIDYVEDACVATELARLRLGPRGTYPRR